MDLGTYAEEYGEDLNTYREDAVGARKAAVEPTVLGSTAADVLTKGGDSAGKAGLRGDRPQRPAPLRGVLIGVPPLMDGHVDHGGAAGRAADLADL
jgi:hypothetical protein